METEGQYMHTDGLVGGQGNRKFKDFNSCYKTDIYLCIYSLECTNECKVEE